MLEAIADALQSTSDDITGLLINGANRTGHGGSMGDHIESAHTAGLNCAYTQNCRTQRVDFPRHDGMRLID